VANGYHGQPVVATGTSFGPVGTHHHHKDSGRSHDVANSYHSPPMVAMGHHLVPLAPIIITKI